MYSNKTEKLAKELAKTIIARIILKTKAEQFFRNIETVLLVEGYTDEAFMSKLKIQNLKCIAISGVAIAEDALKKSFYSYCKEKQNDKETSKRDARREVLNTVFILNDEYKKYAKFYGLIDKDFTTDASDGNILVTPTHDLETLLLKTDKTIFGAPEYIKESLIIARYVAYLIGRLEKSLQEHKHRYNKIEYNDYANIFVINDKEIKLEDLIKLSDLIDIDKLMELSINDKSNLEAIKREISRDSIFGDEIEDISEDVIYDIANGHDILNIMEFWCKDNPIKEFEEKQRRYRKRYKEYAIIDMYSLKNFGKCSLCKEMIAKELKPTVI